MTKLNAAESINTETRIRSVPRDKLEVSQVNPTSLIWSRRRGCFFYISILDESLVFDLDIRSILRLSRVHFILVAIFKCVDLVQTNPNLLLKLLYTM